MQLEPTNGRIIHKSGMLEAEHHMYVLSWNGYTLDVWLLCTQYNIFTICLRYSEYMRTFGNFPTAWGGSVTPRSRPTQSSRPWVVMLASTWVTARTTWPTCCVTYVRRPSRKQGESWKWIKWWRTCTVNNTYLYIVHVSNEWTFQWIQKVELNTFSVPSQKWVTFHFIHVSIPRCRWYPPKQREQECVAKLWRIYLNGCNI